MFDEDLIIKCYEAAKLNLLLLYTTANAEYKSTPFWNLKQQWMLRGAKSTFLLLIEKLNRMESEYKIKKMKEEPYA